MNVPTMTKPAAATNAAFPKGNDPGTEIEDLKKRLAKLEAVLKVNGGSVTIQVPGELRIAAGTVRMDAPGGVTIQPRLTTMLFNATVIDGVNSITCSKINGLRLNRVPPFIFPF